MLVIIDMQEDFCNHEGKLFSKGCDEVIKPIAKRVDKARKNKETVIWTKDSHHKNENTVEKLTLPAHCVIGSVGHNIIHDLVVYVEPYDVVIEKSSFGAPSLVQFVASSKDNDVIELCGVCTDICVISNALLLRSFFPNKRIVVNSKLCVGTSPKSHQKALDVMKMNCIEVI